MCLRQGHQRFTVAEADLEGPRRIAAEQRGEIERCVAGLDAEMRPKLAPSALLRNGHAAGPHHEEADRAGQ